MKLTQQLASTTLTPLLRLNQSRLLERSERERGHDPEYKKEGKNCRQYSRLEDKVSNLY